MTSINDALSPNLLFNIFKRLDCIQTTRIRRVCKQWFVIIDEHKSFWRTLHLPENSLECDPSILELFDRQSESTLQDVDIGMRVERDHHKQIFDTLEKSKHSLKHLFLKVRVMIGLEDLLDSFSSMESLRLLRLHDSFKVRLRRRSNKSDSREDGSNTASPLRVLWYRDNIALLQINRERFKNLVSLDSGATLTASEWRNFLEGPSRILKHFRLGFRNGRYEDHSGILPLNFPNLEILELIDGGRFPPWLLIPDSVKLITFVAVFNLPSISELWARGLSSHNNDIITRLPKLETLSLGHVYSPAEVERSLRGRKGNVEAGLKVDGVKMEMVKSLILPFTSSELDTEGYAKEYLGRCRGLVEVIEGDSQSRFIDVEF